MKLIFGCWVLLQPILHNLGHSRRSSWNAVWDTHQNDSVNFSSVKHKERHYISQLVCAVLLVNFAGRVSLYSPLNLKVCFPARPINLRVKYLINLVFSVTKRYVLISYILMLCALLSNRLTTLLTSSLFSNRYHQVQRSLQLWPPVSWAAVCGARCGLVPSPTPWAAWAHSPESIAVRERSGT